MRTHGARVARRTRGQRKRGEVAARCGLLAAFPAAHVKRGGINAGRHRRPHFTGRIETMTIDAEQLLAAALKKVDLRGGFDPAELGSKAGLSKPQAVAAARVLANAGVLVLGFDGSA